jgi:hypothetical protein
MHPQVGDGIPSSERSLSGGEDRGFAVCSRRTEAGAVGGLDEPATQPGGEGPLRPLGLVQGTLSASTLEQAR